MVGSNADLCSCELSCPNKIQKLEDKDDQLSKPVEDGTFVPVTPVPERRNADLVLGSDTPLTWVSSPIKEGLADCEGAEVTDSGTNVETPKSCVFNPFAPGPDELMFAPRKKNSEGLRSQPMRRLNFDLLDVSMELVGENDQEDSEEKFLETVYESFLDAIVSKQAEGMLAENRELNLGLCDGLKTPTSSPLLTGIADACPGAPKKQARESRKINLDVCRKLEF